MPQNKLLIYAFETRLYLIKHQGQTLQKQIYSYKCIEI